MDQQLFGLLFLNCIYLLLRVYSLSRRIEKLEQKVSNLLDGASQKV
jgi:hypothetical protein